MGLWQWVIMICFPILTIEHVCVTLWIFFKRDQNEIRDKQWQDIFESINKSYNINSKVNLKIWEEMKERNGTN